jgi:hypothetical protein
MVKKEVGAIIVALLLVATLGAGVANAVVIGGCSECCRTRRWT